MLEEQYFSDRSSYPKVSDTATPIYAVEWFAKNVGITNLDDPSVKVKTILDDVNESELARHEARRAREAKAQDEFLDAMFNLDSGTAVLRQKSERTKPAKKVVPAKQLKVAKNIAKPAKEKVNVAKKPVKTINFSEKMTTKVGQEVLDQIKEKGFYQVSDFQMSRVYLGNIISDIRELGYKLVGVKSGRLIVRYELDAQ
ncbi:hypothetical protein [Psychrobacter aquimaris]|uniref:hypothetical protein n=1 Tax=Psychrobacter aquimaris TaxID=292733 RepID=UPI0018DFA834|nr:hypothetical protein [Psychrobacter aquimaris]